MKSTLKGKILKHEFHNGAYYTVIAEPAPDQYSMPNKFKVRSDTQLGNVDDEVSLNIQVSGFVKPKSWTDKQTGQQRSFDEANVNLQVIPAKAS